LKRFPFLSLIAPIALAGLIALAGCEGGDKPNAAGAGVTAVQKEDKPGTAQIKVGLVFDSGGRGDKSFNDSAYAGLEQAMKDLGIEGKTIDSRQEKDYETNLSAMAENGSDLVIAVGLAQANALQTVAPNFPNTKFAIVDAVVDQPNVRSLVFNEEQGSYLAGYLAGLVTKTNKIGFVGGMDVPLIEKFEAGYTAGAKDANPKVEVLPSKYTSSWEDVGLGKAAALTLFNSGADIVYHAAGRAGLGVIDAARETEKYAIGVDSDQDGIAPGRVLTSMLKRVDIAVFKTISDVATGTFTGGVRKYDVIEGGIGLTDFAFTKEVVGDANIRKLYEIKDKIASGEITPPTSRAELKNYR
jgi:basic membrane protein A